MPGQNHEQITSALAGGIINFLTPQQLAQGQFVVTPAAAQAYMNQQNVALPSYIPPPVVAPPVVAPPVVVPQQQQQPTPRTNNTPIRTTSTNTSSSGRSGY